jgi:hypothetical protein
VKDGAAVLVGCGVEVLVLIVGIAVPGVTVGTMGVLVGGLGVLVGNGVASHGGP